MTEPRWVDNLDVPVEVTKRGRPPAARATYGAVVLSPYPEVRERAAQYLAGLPPLPRAPRHLRYSEDQERDEAGRFGSGGGGSSSAKGRATVGPARLHSGDEAAVRAAYEFHDEQPGLHVEVDSIRNAGPNQSTYVTAYIRDDAGEIRGVAEHVIRPPGQRSAELGGLAIEPEFQGQGFGARYMDLVEQSYREAGIEEITLTADIDVGGYSWARDGYNFRTSEARGRVGRMAREEGRRFNPEVQQQIREVADDPEATPAEFAMIGWARGASTWPGKQIMMGSLWEGAKRL